jgi:hypothetical protein
MTAVELAIERDLEAGRHREVVPRWRVPGRPAVPRCSWSTTSTVPAMKP